MSDTEVLFGSTGPSDDTLLMLEVPVPEPATLALFGVGLAGLGFAAAEGDLSGFSAWFSA